jgi:hypothetical protein
MRDMPSQKYMFPVDAARPARERPATGRDPDHEARKILAGEIEAAIMFDNLNKFNKPKMTPEGRGAVAQAIRAQAARKRPRREREESPARKLLAAQIEYLLAIHELNKGSIDDIEAAGPPEEFNKLIKRIHLTINYINRIEKC